MRKRERDEMRVSVFERYGVRTRKWVTHGCIRGEIRENAGVGRVVTASHGYLFV